MTGWQGTPRSAALVLGGVLVVLAAAGCVERRDDPAPSARRQGTQVGGQQITVRAEVMTQPGDHVLRLRSVSDEDLVVVTSTPHRFPPGVAVEAVGSVRHVDRGLEAELGLEAGELTRAAAGSTCLVARSVRRLLASAGDEVH